MIKLIALGVFFLCSQLFAGVFEHLHKIPPKDGNHSFKNIDCVYMINLDERPEKWKASFDQLAPYGVNPLRFSAVNGWKLSFEELEDLSSLYKSKMGEGRWGTYYPPSMNGEPCHEVMMGGKKYFSHCMSRGAVGIVLSHLSILKDAYDAGYQIIWVLEDDIEIVQDPKILSSLIKNLDSMVGIDGWDILFTS